MILSVNYVVKILYSRQNLLPSSLLNSRSINKCLMLYYVPRHNMLLCVYELYESFKEKSLGYIVIGFTINRVDIV